MVNGSTITLNVPPHWAVKDRMSVLDRVARFVSDRQPASVKKEQGRGFSLDVVGNNWWGYEEPGKIRIDYRYGHGYEEEMRALETVLIFLFGLDHLNQKETV